MRDKSKISENKREDPDLEISVKAISDQPETAFELINKYGTYEIQPTADTVNDYPQIAQGLAEKEKGRERIKD